MLTLLTIGMLCNINAQVKKLYEASECLQQKNYICAKNKIDSVVANPETIEEPYAWTIRAFAYYGLFKQNESAKYQSKYREEAVKSIEKSTSLNPTEENKIENKKIIKAAAESYYNQINLYLHDSLNFNICQELYSHYKKLYTQIDTTFRFKDKDLEFYLTVGGVFADAYTKSEFTKEEYGDIAKTCFNKAIEIDQQNVTALFNLGSIYYNQGAQLIKQMSFDTPIDQIEQIQDNSIKFFKQALPYMLKAYELNPKEEKIVRGLTGIYYALHDTDKYIEFGKKLKELEQKK